MGINLVDTVVRALLPDVVTDLAHLLDEDEWTIRRGLSSLVPVLLGGMAAKAVVPGSASGLLIAIDNPTLDPELAHHFNSALASGQHAVLKQVGAAQLSLLFGADKVAALSRSLSGITGMRSSSATSLLMTTMPMLLGVLKGIVGEQRLDARGLSALLAAQRDSLADQLEPRLTSALGLGTPAALLQALDAPAADARRVAAGAGHGGGIEAAVERESAVWRWAPWLMGVVLPLLLLLSLVPRCSAMLGLEAGSDVDLDATLATPVRFTAILPAKVEFKSGSAAPTAYGAAVVESVATLLLAMPANRVEVTAFALRTGDAQANSDLANRRATSVAVSLQSAGVPSDRITLKPPMFVEIGSSGSDVAARRVVIALAS